MPVTSKTKCLKLKIFLVNTYDNNNNYYYCCCRNPIFVSFHTKQQQQKKQLKLFSDALDSI